MFVAALCLIHPGTVADLIGLAIGVPIYLWQRWRYRENLNTVFQPARSIP